MPHTPPHDPTIGLDSEEIRRTCCAIGFADREHILQRTDITEYHKMVLLSQLPENSDDCRSFHAFAMYKDRTLWQYGLIAWNMFDYFVLKRLFRRR